MPRHKSFADGSASGVRPESPCVRAIDSYMTLGARADKLSGQLDHVTVGGFSNVTLQEDDSLVLVIADFVTGEEDTGKKSKMGG